MAYYFQAWRLFCRGGIADSGNKADSAFPWEVDSGGKEKEDQEREVTTEYSSENLARNLFLESSTELSF